jgi:hypothetical protein
MPNPTSPEADAIGAAYMDEVKNLYHALFANMTGDLDNPNDQENVKRFSTGFGIAKRARDLALNAITAAPQWST